MRVAKEKLDTSLGKLKIYLEGRKNIFLDFANQNHSAQESLATVKEAGLAFEEAQNQFAAVEDAFKEYINADRKSVV